jgi:hypothetical protein
MNNGWTYLRLVAVAPLLGSQLQCRSVSAADDAAFNGNGLEIYYCVHLLFIRP